MVRLRFRSAFAVAFLAGAASAADDVAVYVEALNAIPDPQQLSAYHDRFGSVSHWAGSPGDAFVIAELEKAFRSFGLEVERHEFHAYLPQPISGKVDIVEPEAIVLPVQERAVDVDPDSSTPAVSFAFNAFSGSGDVTGEVVYVNYGRKEDFAQLRELGVDLRGRIALARYGGNYRGYKAKFAEEAGAAGLVIYTDPADSGYMKGQPYPDGGFANESSIQRGSIKTLPYAGDPLTPGIEATEDAERLDPDTVALPRIPVQPVGWGAAQEIMSRMTGRALPQAWVPGWQGALPFAYRVEGGPELRIRVRVQQPRRVTKTANVIGILRGTEAPDDWVVLGCHHDAWGIGAGDPLAGLICLLESARSFGELAQRGIRPRRSILFAAWGAEEMGIIGSTEWCEGKREHLSEHGVAYLNLDMAAMGPNFRSSASPILHTAIERAAERVPAVDASLGSVAVNWNGRFGDLGGGSDHIGFLCHLGIPSASLGGGGSAGVSYHSGYDTRHWYRMVVGDDYEPARMVTRMANALAADLAHAELLPLDPTRYHADITRHLDGIAARAAAIETEDWNDADVRRAFDRLHLEVGAVLADARDAIAGTPSGRVLDETNRFLRQAERVWLGDGRGLPGRPWFQSLFAASDPDSGYAAWPLPGLRAVVEGRAGAAERAAMLRRYAAVAARLDLRVELLRDVLGRAAANEVQTSPRD